MIEIQKETFFENIVVQKTNEPVTTDVRADAFLAGAMIRGMRESPVSPQSLEALDLMTNEQKELVGKFSSAMAERFEVDADEFSVIHTLEPRSGRNEFTVVYAAEQGLTSDSPKVMFSRKRSKDYMITLDDGKVYDSRMGMTRRVYSKMIANARQSTKPIPDSQGTRTIITGEDVGDSYLATRMVVDGVVLKRSTSEGMKHSAHRFRPAIKVPSPEQLSADSSPNRNGRSIARRLRNSRKG